MTEITVEGGEVIKTDLPEEKVADLKQPEAEPKPEPKEPVKQPEPTEKPAEAKAEDSNTAPPQEDNKREEQQPRSPETGKFTRKAGPIADLLEKKHALESELENERKARQELEAKLKPSPQSTSQITQTIQALSEKYGVEESFLSELADALRPELPKEVQDLISKQKESQIQEAETKAFNSRVDKLKTVFKDEPLDDPKVKEKLLALAYSTDKAPDGEPYYQKELSELYFGYIKPEIEPGKVSAEPSRGGSKASQVLDFEQIHNDEAKLEEFARTAPSEQWKSYVKWRNEKQPDSKIIRKTN